MGIGSSPWGSSVASQGWCYSSLIHAVLGGAWYLAATAEVVEQPRWQLGLHVSPAITLEMVARPADRSDDSPILPLEIEVEPQVVRVQQQHFVIDGETQGRPVPDEIGEGPLPEEMGAPMEPRRAVVTMDRSLEEPFTEMPLAAKAMVLPPVDMPRQSHAVPATASSLASTASATSPVELPEFLENQPPVYPRQAVVARWQGTVWLRLSIAQDGRVTEVSLLESSGHPVLDAAAVQAVRRWRAKPRPAETVTYQPSEQNPQVVRLPIRFLLSQPGGRP